MILQYEKAPLYMMDSIPAYKAGEWPGVKSNHFTPTRRIIRALNKETVFNNDYLPIFGRKHFKVSKSKEYTYKSGIRIGNHHPSSNEKNDTLFPAKLNPSARALYQRSNYFKKREDYTKSLSERIEKKENKVVVKNDFDFLSELGFNKNDYSKFLDDDYIRKKNKSTNNFHLNFTKHREEEKLNNFKLEQENVKRDVEYVKYLDDWEKFIILPTINSKK